MDPCQPIEITNSSGEDLQISVNGAATRTTLAAGKSRTFWYNEYGLIFKAGKLYYVWDGGEKLIIEKKEVVGE